MSKSFFIKDKISFHFKQNSRFYSFAIIFSVIGLIVGIVLSLSDFSFVSILKNSDKNMFDYITGQVDYHAIFYMRLKDLIICLLIIFVFNITVYTSFLSYIFMAYQMALIVLSCSALVSLYGFSGVLNILLFIIPINILNYILLMVFNVLCVARGYRANRYKIPFSKSFNEDDLWKEVLITVLVLIILCLVNSFIIPLLIKSFVLVVY